MLKKFAVTSYRGFKERLEWNLSNPSNYNFSGYAIKDGIIKNGIIYGPNGSGKSNLGMAIFDIEHHLSTNTIDPKYFMNYSYANTMRNVDFEYTFQFGDKELQYNYTNDYNGNILSEELFVNGKLAFRHTYNTFEYDNEEFTFSDMFVSQIKHNGNNLVIVNFITMYYPLPKGHFLLKLKDFVKGMLWFRSLLGNEFIGELGKSGESLEGYIIENRLVDDFADFLNKVSEQNFKFVKPKEGEKALLIDFGRPVPFQLVASTGTKSLLLLYYWYKHLDSDNVYFVFIDEFDAFYHFRLAYEVCKKMFNLKCQVFMSSHNTYLMTNDLLRPDCNFILNNNLIKPLCDCTEKEIRFGNNVEKLYRGGAFNI